MAKVDPNPDAELTLEQHEQRLEAGWQWLERYPNRRDSQKNCDLWIKQLRRYEQCFRETEAERLRLSQSSLPGVI